MASMSEAPQKPFWVQLSLSPFSSRKAQWFFVWLSLVSAIAAMAYGWHADQLYRGAEVGIVAVVAAALYRLAIRWMDMHNAWSDRDPRP
jgi:hypothetical protein